MALVLLVKFNSSLDQPLYEYGDILLTRRFYYQLIYILVVVALVLLVPLYNAASAFLFSSDAKRAEAARGLLILVSRVASCERLAVFVDRKHN